MPTRRQFLRDCSALAVGTSIFSRTVLAHPGARNVSLDEIPFSAFARRVRSDFLAFAGSRLGTVLRLLAAQPEPANGGKLAEAEDATNEKFTLLFTGQIRERLEQGTYLFEHNSLGRFEMFIVPVGRDDSSWMYYEAVFNRPSSALTDIGRKRMLR